MLAIRLQRRGRSGHASFRMVVQDSRWSPKSGKFVALLGSYDPHTKTTTLTKEKAEFYLKNGAQPSDRVVTLFKKEGVKLPKWIVPVPKRKGKIRNPEKLRRNRVPEPTSTETSKQAAKAETEIHDETDGAKSSTFVETGGAVVTVDKTSKEEPSSVIEEKPTEPQEQASEDQGVVVAEATIAESKAEELSSKEPKDGPNQPAEDVAKAPKETDDKST